jgi:signal transduction histidine kinase
MTTGTMIPTSDPDLGALLQAYNDVAERLKQSHDVLTQEVHRLRSQLKEKDRELQRRERLAALGQMAAGVAHEIRNPLGGIRIFASVLERDLAELPKQKEIARKIGDGVVTVESIVRDILAFAGGAEPTLEHVSFGEVVDRVGVLVESKAKSLDVSVAVEEPAEDAVMLCDPRLIDRALSNLVFNAIEAAGAGGHVWIRQGCVAPGDELVAVVVEDDGCGIDPGSAQRIFNPFYTTKESGTGLGLAIVHGIVEAHGGHIRVQPRVGGGSTFELALPLARCDGGAQEVVTRVA